MDITMNRPAADPFTPPSARAGSRRSVVAGRVLSTLVALMLTLDAVGKLLRVQEVLDGTAQLGYSTSLVAPIGATLLICVAIYAVPRTAFPGAVLLTAYLGGAVATHVRVGNPLLTHVLTPAYLGIALWLGLYLRDATLRALVFSRRES